MKQKGYNRYQRIRGAVNTRAENVSPASSLTAFPLNHARFFSMLADCFQGIKLNKKPTKTVDYENEFSLIKAAQGGDQTALRQLVEKYEQTVNGFSFKVCRNGEDAEDTLQEAFLNILKSLKSFNFQSSFSTWIYRIVSNSCLMKFRKEKRERWESFEALDRPEDRIQENYTKWPDTPIDEVLTDELKHEMDEAILDLPPIYRLPFVMKDLEGLKIDEVAEALQISVPAAKARLRRARLFLRDKLEPYMER